MAVVAVIRVLSSLIRGHQLLPLIAYVTCTVFYKQVIILIISLIADQLESSKSKYEAMLILYGYGMVWNCLWLTFCHIPKEIAVLINCVPFHCFPNEAL